MHIRLRAPVIKLEAELHLGQWEIDLQELFTHSEPDPTRFLVKKVHTDTVKTANQNIQFYRDVILMANRSEDGYVYLSTEEVRKF